MLTLSLAGLAYAHWVDTLFINGTINTGSINVKYTYVACSDTGIDPGYNKDIANCTTTISADGKTFLFTINNAYPSYHFWLTVNVTNLGTVPVYSAPTGFFAYSVSGNPPGAAPLEDWLTVNNTSGWPLGQIDGGQTVQVRAFVHFEETTPQSAHVTITGNMTFWNWNEAEPMG